VIIRASWVIVGTVLPLYALDSWGYLGSYTCRINRAEILLPRPYKILTSYWGAVLVRDYTAPGTTSYAEVFILAS
jgi:hypothetical protein